MECRRWVRGPDIHRPERDCACEHCVAEDRRVALLDELEVALRQPIVQVLEAGMMPDDIVSTVRARAPKKSRAWMLTRIELANQAGSWAGQPDWADQLEQVKKLCKGTGFKIGPTIDGWLHDWAARTMYVEDRVLIDAVSDVWQSLVDVLTTTTAFVRPDDGARDRAASRPPLPANVVQFPGGRR